MLRRVGIGVTVELSDHAKKVNAYYDAYLDQTYIGPTGWDPEHLHFGIFRERDEEAYRLNPNKVVEDRAAAIRLMTETILRPAGLGESDAVVDAGCGVGGTARYIARTHGSSVVGLNINEMQLEIARERTREAGLQEVVSFKACDCSEDLPFDDDSIDAVVNIEAACHFSDRAAFISESARILRSGGRIVAQDWMAADCVSPQEKAKYLDPLCEAWTFADLDRISSYSAMLEDAGFEVAEAEYLDGILPIGYLVKQSEVALAQKEQTSGLSDREVWSKKMYGTFAEALLAGHLKIGRYFAVKK